MKKIIVTTNTRTGSTWLCRIIYRLTGMPFKFAKTIKEAEKLWDKGVAVKTHRVLIHQILPKHPDALIITIVRNPKDKTTSQYFFSGGNEKAYNTVMENNLNFGEERQLKRMIPGYSSRNPNRKTDINYWWTTFEWLKEDTVKETQRLAKFLGTDHRKGVAEISVKLAQRESEIYGRIRKGKVNSWKEDLPNRLNTLDKYQEMYYNVVNQELGKEN